MGIADCGQQGGSVGYKAAIETAREIAESEEIRKRLKGGEGGDLLLDTEAASASGEED